jgi:hypothetical protein
LVRFARLGFFVGWASADISRGEIAFFCIYLTERCTTTRAC